MRELMLGKGMLGFDPAALSSGDFSGFGAAPDDIVVPADPEAAVTASAPSNTDVTVEKPEGAA